MHLDAGRYKQISGLKVPSCVISDRPDRYERVFDYALPRICLLHRVGGRNRCRQQQESRQLLQDANWQPACDLPGIMIFQSSGTGHQDPATVITDMSPHGPGPPLSYRARTFTWYSSSSSKPVMVYEDSVGNALPTGSLQF